MKKKSIYLYAAEAGVPVGLYLTLMSFCILLSLRLEFLPFFFLILAIGFPFMLARTVRGIGKAEASYMKFSSLWLAGIYSVIFGTLISTFFSALYITFAEPGFVTAYIQKSISMIEVSDLAAEYEPAISVMKNAMDNHALPSGMEFLMTMGWFTCFCGSILSLVIAFIVSQAAGRSSKRIEDAGLN